MNLLTECCPVFLARPSLCCQPYRLVASVFVCLASVDIAGPSDGFCVMDCATLPLGGVGIIGIIVTTTITITISGSSNSSNNTVTAVIIVRVIIAFGVITVGVEFLSLVLGLFTKI